MTFYMLQTVYSPESLEIMVRHPQDREAKVRKVIEGIGGKLHQFFFTMGEYDLLIICQMPDEVAMTALNMAIGASGTMKALKTTKLLTSEEGMIAMTQAHAIKYPAMAVSSPE